MRFLKAHRVIVDRRIFLVLFLLVILQAACADWGTSYSGKDDESNQIQIFLNHYGGYFFGHEGIHHEVKEQYMFSFEPIKPVYTDDEIKLEAIPSFEKLKPIKGVVSFEHDYTIVTINIQIEKDGVFSDFSGNGTYKINENGG